MYPLLHLSVWTGWMSNLVEQLEFFTIRGEKSLNNTITKVPGIEVGHYTNLEAATGCTVILCRQGAVGGVDVRGSAPETRNTDLLRPQ